MGPLESVCVMRTKLRDNSCKNHRILLPLLHPCALQFSCALHLFALLSDHTHIHFWFCLHSRITKKGFLDTRLASTGGTSAILALAAPFPRVS